MLDLLRQSVYSRLAGYEDVNDAQRLSFDPAMRAITGKIQAANWNKPRRVVAKVEWHQGELFPRVGFFTEILSRIDRLRWCTT